MYILQECCYSTQDSYFTKIGKGLSEEKVQKYLRMGFLNNNKAKHVTDLTNSN